MQNVEVNRVAGAQHAIGENVRMRIAAVAGDGVDRLHLLGAELEEQSLGLGHDLAHGDTRTQQLVDALIDRVDDGGGVMWRIVPDKG